MKRRSLEYQKRTDVVSSWMQFFNYTNLILCSYFPPIKDWWIFGPDLALAQGPALGSHHSGCWHVWPKLWLTTYTLQVMVNKVHYGCIYSFSHSKVVRKKLDQRARHTFTQTQFHHLLTGWSLGMSLNISKLPLPGLWRGETAKIHGVVKRNKWGLAKGCLFKQIGHLFQQTSHLLNLELSHMSDIVKDLKDTESKVTILSSRSSRCKGEDPQDDGWLQWNRC